MTRLFVLLYLLAAVAANVVVAHFGPGATPFVAFGMVGATMTVRDALHDAWAGRGLGLRMAALVLAGAALSFALGGDVQRIALASGAAFAASETLDALVYQAGRRWSWSRAVRVWNSNGASALVDSLLFPLLAFGALVPELVAGQYLAKVGGGVAWLLVLSSTWARTRRDGCPGCGSPSSCPSGSCAAGSV